MKETPHVPAKNVVKHIQRSRSRVEVAAANANAFRQGMRALLADVSTLRIVLEDKPEDLARLEQGAMAIQYAANGVLGALDQYMRFEQVLQAECERWLHGRPPGLERGRPRIAAYEASKELPPKEESPLAQDGRPPKNGPLPPVGKGAFGYVKAQGQELPPRFYRKRDGTTVPWTQDPALAIGFYDQKDPVNGSVQRVWVNAYDEVVAPPEGQDVSISICGVGQEPKLASQAEHDEAMQEVVAHQQSQD